MEKGRLAYKLPEGWIIVRLEEISKQITDGSHNPPKRYWFWHSNAKCEKH